MRDAPAGATLNVRGPVSATALLLCAQLWHLPVGRSFWAAQTGCRRAVRFASGRFLQTFASLNSSTATRRRTDRTGRKPRPTWLRHSAAAALPCGPACAERHCVFEWRPCRFVCFVSWCRGGPRLEAFCSDHFPIALAVGRYLPVPITTTTRSHQGHEVSTRTAPSRRTSFVPSSQVGIEAICRIWLIRHQHPFIGYSRKTS